MSKSRICHVITKPELGGAQLSTLEAVSRLSRDKYELSIITSPDGILDKDFKNLKNTKTIFSKFLTRPINPILDILALIHLYYIYCLYKYEIIHTHSSKAGILGRWAGLFYNLTQFLKKKRKGCKIIHTVHGWPFNNYQVPIVKWFYIFVEKLTATFTTKIICVSNQDIATGLKYKIAPKHKFILIRYGIPLSRFRRHHIDRSIKKMELGIKNDYPVVGMISCLKPQKAPLDYIRSAMEVYKNTPYINFLLIGDGVLKERCKKALLKSSLNGKFIFTGWRRDVDEILDVIDIVVLTSRWEGMPIALIEALCKGKPIVATNAGGIKELVKDGHTGYIFPPGSYKDIATSILRLVNNQPLLDRMKKAALESIDDSFDITRMVSDIENLYEAIL